MRGAFVRLLGLAGLIATIIGQSHAQTPADGTQPFEHAQRLLDQGAYGEAERVTRQLKADVESRDGPDSVAFARALGLLVEAMIRNGKAGAAETLHAAERAFRVQEGLVGPEHLETARALYRLGNVNLERGEFTLAVSRYERALDIRQRRLASDDLVIGDSLDGLALALIRLQRHDEARQALNRVLAIREATSDRAPLALARTLELVAWLNRYSGDYAAAVPLIDRALGIWTRLAPNHPDVVTAMEVRGDLYWLQSDLAAARSTWGDGLALSGRTLWSEHPTNAALLRRLAMAARIFGEAAEERRLLERGLQMADNVLAPCHPELGWLMNDMAQSLKWDGEYIEAQTLLRRTRTTIEKCLGPSHSNVATAVHNLAALASAMGDDAEAQRLHERATTIWSASLGPNHPFVAKSLDALADVLATRGATGRARALHERALAIRRRPAGNEHPDVASTLTSLARLSARSGDHVTALRYLNQAIASYQRAGESDDPDHLARALMLRAEIEKRRGELTSARTTLLDALTIRERAFGPRHPLAAESRAELASTDFALGAWEPALETALGAERDGRDHLRFTIRYLPERQAMAYASKRPQALDLTVSMAAIGRPSDPAPAYDAVIQSRGIVLDELAARARSTTSIDPQLAALNVALDAARQRFANLMLRTLQGGDPIPRAILDQARQQKEDAERELAGRSAAVQAELTRARAGLAGVRAALPTQSAMVSFVRYERTVVLKSPRTPTLRMVPSYIAFVIRSNSSDVSAVPLGSAISLETIVKSWRDEAARGAITLDLPPKAAENAYRTVGDRLRRRMWDPLTPHLAGISRVFIVPDGALNFVSVVALPTPGGAYLGEGPQVLHYLSTERDLIPTAAAAEARGMLAVGGPAFGSPGTAKATALRASSSNGALSPCEDLRSRYFHALPGSTNEAAEVARIWSTGDTGDAMLLTGRAATETAVKRAVAGRQIVHFATHGFFLSPRCAIAPAGPRTGLSASSTRASPTESPLLLSGLAFAGANNRRPATASQDDGILTAEEVAGLNLQSAEWAVLSACETGLGEIKAGEGVFGLRRAFQIAGARTVIMSLWAIDDDATLNWMSALYRARISKRLNTADAMHDAGLAMLRDRRARGQSTHPFYWAGFVAAGDWK